MSSVGLERPSKNVARYRFGSRCTYSISRVAAPTHTTSTPVAKGSSVPACPVRAGRTRHLTTSTASREVLPAGLSMVTTPESGVDVGRERGMRVAPFEFILPRKDAGETPAPQDADARRVVVRPSRLHIPPTLAIEKPCMLRIRSPALRKQRVPTRGCHETELSGRSLMVYARTCGATLLSVPHRSLAIRMARTCDALRIATLSPLVPESKP